MLQLRRITPTLVWVVVTMTASILVLPTAAAEPLHEYNLWGEKVQLGIPEDKFPSQDDVNRLDAKLPGKCSHWWFHSNYKGKKLHFCKMLPPNGEPPKAVIVYMHGISSRAGTAWTTKDGRKLNLSLLMEEFVNKQGYAIYAFDMLGHGFSEGSPRHYVPDWKVNRDDLDDFARFAAAQHEDVPLFLCGESYGGCLSLHVATDWQESASFAPQKFGGLLLLAPAIVVDLPPAPLYWILRHVLAPLIPKSSPFFLPDPIPAHRLWRDVEVMELNQQPSYTKMGLEGCHDMCLGTALQMLVAMEEARQVVIPKLRVPFCAMHGTMDHAVPVEGTTFLKENAKTRKSQRAIHLVEGGYHDLLADPAAEKVAQHMVAFVEKQIERMRRTGDLETRTAESVETELHPVRVATRSAFMVPS